MKKYLMKCFFLVGLFTIFLIALPLCFAEQILWDDDSNINITDTWRDIDGLPLTGADCSWEVFNSDGTSNQSGIPSELSAGVLNFTVNDLSIGIYPMLINCTKSGYNGTSSKDSIKIVDELSEEYKNRLVEINQTTQDIYDLLLNDMNETLTKILNYTNLTYNKVLAMNSEIDSIITKIDSLRDYLEDKWGNEDADKIMEKLKDIKSDLSYLKSEFYYLSFEAKNQVWLSIKQDTRELKDFFYEDEIKWEGIFKWVIPCLGVLLLIIIVAYLVKRKAKVKESFGGEMNGNSSK